MLQNFTVPIFDYLIRPEIISKGVKNSNIIQNSSNEIKADSLQDKNEKNNNLKSIIHNDEIKNTINSAVSGKIIYNDIYSANNHNLNEEKLMRKNETILWFNTLNTGFNLQNDYEINQLILIREKLLEIEYNCPGYISKAVRFAKLNKGQNFSKFCSLLKFFEVAFVKWV